MESTHEVRQANRVADVSDLIDSLHPTRADAVWERARKLYRDGDVSFLEAFENSLRIEEQRAPQTPNPRNI